TWERFTKCLRMVPNHKIVDDALVKIFYRALDENSQAYADTIMGGMFLDQPFALIATRMEQVVKIVAIKQHKKQFRKVYSQLNQHQNSTLPRNMFQKPKNEGHCMVVMTQSGKSVVYPPMLINVDKVNGKGLGGEV
ncbi:MAG: hypothetical protein Q8830_04060, partial [Candidatus Phytoplasma australasiaticum]|nr:hypothetical protein [Candidatus Phytoplasma australasiaticum]